MTLIIEPSLNLSFFLCHLVGKFNFFFWECLRSFCEFWMKLFDWCLHVKPYLAFSKVIILLCKQNPWTGWGFGTLSKVTLVLWTFIIVPLLSRQFLFELFLLSFSSAVEWSCDSFFFRIIRIVASQCCPSFQLC